MSLKEYQKKRDFRKTAEPKADRPERAERYRFVVQKHAASRLHYDFRLELGGTLKSWAVPKGVPFKKGERRLAVHVEDHPVSYIDFEGTIPQGQYGGGTVMVWDRGTFEPLSDSPLQELEGGKLHFMLKGEKLKGEWYLVQLRGGDEWLLIKGGEDMKPVTAKADDTSVRSGKTMAQLSKADGDEGQSAPREKKSFRAQVAEAARAAKGKALEPDTDAEATTAPPSRKAPKPRRGAKSAGESSTAPKGTKRRTRVRAAAAASLPVKRARPSKRKGDGKQTGTTARAAVRKQSKTVRTPTPTPRFIEPMKARLVEAPPPGDWIYEIKYDGFRAIAYRDAAGTRLLSRNNKDFAAKFPEVVGAIGALEVADLVVDGEVVAVDEQGRSSFQLLQAYDLGEQRPPIFFYAFDLLQLNGRDLRARPLHERKAELEGLLRQQPESLIRYSRSLGNDPEQLLEQARQLGLEGLIGKQPESRYEAGQRSGAWIKLKLHQEQEFVVGGYTPPGGTRPYFGALLVGVYEKGQLKFAGKVGTGFNKKRLASLHATFQQIRRDTCPFVDLPEKRSGRYGAGVTAAEMRRCTWLEPVKVAQIKFAEWTRDDRLRQPVFLGLREDKAATAVVRERKE